MKLLTYAIAGSCGYLLYECSTWVMARVIVWMVTGI